MLRRAGYQVVAETDSVSQTLRKIRSLYCDLLIVDSGLEGGKGNKLAEIVDQDLLAGVLLLVDNDVTYLNHESAYVIKPVSSEKLLPAVQSVLWNWHRESILRQRIRQLEDKLETRVIMDKAKGLLMDVNGWSEEQAHRYIQKEAMNRSITARQMSALILEDLTGSGVAQTIEED